MTLHKQFSVVDTKADSDEGTFEATVAVFGNVDSMGDRIVPGAFAKTLGEWRKTGDPIPVILSHQWDNPMSHIGVVHPQDVKETPKGLLVKGRLDVADNEVARQVHRLMKRRSLREFSFGYRVPSGGQKRGKDGANELLEIDLVELGPTLKGANPATELHEVKSALHEADMHAVLKELRDVKRRLDEIEKRSAPENVDGEAVVEDSGNADPGKAEGEDAAGSDSDDPDVVGEPVVAAPVDPALRAALDTELELLCDF